MRNFNKWCAILCDYQTNEYEKFKRLIRKIELFEDSILNQQSYL